VIWKAARQGKTAVITTPVVQDDVVFVTSAYGIGCHAFRIHKDGSTEQIYESKEVANHHGGVVLVDGYVYGSSGRHFTCIDIKSGELKYKDRSVGKGATTFAEGHLYLRSETGPVALIKATPEGLKEVSRFDQPDRSKRKSWAHPVIANGKLYLRDQELLLCYDIKS
jgi:outer membrane protein assembly factor BamB